MPRAWSDQNLVPWLLRQIGNHKPRARSLESHQDRNSTDTRTTRPAKTRNSRPLTPRWLNESRVSRFHSPSPIAIQSNNEAIVHRVIAIAYGAPTYPSWTRCPTCLVSSSTIETTDPLGRKLTFGSPIGNWDCREATAKAAVHNF